MFSIKKGIINKPCKKIAIGSTNFIDDVYAQFLITTYLSSNYKFYPLLSSAPTKLITLRNSLLGADPSYKLRSDDTFWKAQNSFLPTQRMFYGEA